MNLNKFDRQAFVLAVMNDVPAIDYKEQARKLGTSTVVSLLPKLVQETYKEHRNYLDSSGVRMPGLLDNLYMPYPRNSNCWCIMELAPDVWKELEELAELERVQQGTHNNLRKSLTAIIEGCRTLKQAKERLPEFEKYLPTERGTGSGLANLPVANLVADLNAAGWPKGKVAA